MTNVGITFEERRKQAGEWAKNSGFSQGEPMYIRAYMSGYFNHSMTRSDGLEADIIRQFEKSYSDGFTAGQFALNSELGVAENEAAKVERRKRALDKIGLLLPLKHEITMPRDTRTDYEIVEAIIKEAQA